MDQPAPLSILCVGEDAELLKSRAALLSATGAQVRCALTRDAVTAIERQQFDLIVLCHGTRAKEGRQIYEAAHRQSAKSRVLRLAPMWDDGVSDPKSNSDAVASTNPTELMRAVSDLLKDREHWQMD